MFNGMHEFWGHPFMVNLSVAVPNNNAHHPACGSAPGGSQSLPSRSWVINDYPQFFERMQATIGIKQFNAAPPYHSSDRIHRA